MSTEPTGWLSNLMCSRIEQWSEATQLKIRPYVCGDREGKCPCPDSLHQRRLAEPSLRRQQVGASSASSARDTSRWSSLRRWWIGSQQLVHSAYGNILVECDQSALGLSLAGIHTADKANWVRADSPAICFPLRSTDPPR